MGYDDGDCEEGPDGVHEMRLVALVANDRGLINQVHACHWCGAEAYDASADQEARRRPPL